MKIRQGRTMRFYWIFLAVLLSVFINISYGKPNLYFPGQANFKSLPRMGRRSGGDSVSGRHSWNDFYHPVQNLDRNPIFKLGGSGESNEPNWGHLLSSNDLSLLPGNELAFPYRKPAVLTRFHDMAEDSQSQLDNSNNGIFSYGEE